MDEVQKKIMLKHLKAGNICEWKGCKNKSVQIAHRINKGKTGRRAVQIEWLDLFGEDVQLFSERMNDIIHHDFTTVATCIPHNSYVLINISKTLIIRILLKAIKEDLDETQFRAKRNKG